MAQSSRRRARPGGSGKALERDEKPSAAARSRFLREEGFRWLSVPNVVGVSIAEKKRGGQPTGELAVVFDVVAKLPAPADIVKANSRPFPTHIEIDGTLLPVDVVEGWPERHDGSVERGAWREKVCGGISIGNRSENGTLGAIVRERDTGRPAGLSNWHVLANFADDGVTLQPGLQDAPFAQRHLLGRLGNSALDAEVDAAITSIDRSGFDPNILELGVPVRSVAAPAHGMRVVKSGRASGITYGIVDLVEKIVGIPLMGLAARHRILVCTIKPDPARPNLPLTAAGDSGSCWMEVGDDGQPTGTMVALHVGGENQTLAYACHAPAVFERLGIEPLQGGEAALSALPASSDTVPMPSRAYRVIARDGLRVRAGPGAEFERKDGRPFGAIVEIIGSQNDWLLVDLEGDGKADGFMLAAFLRPL